MQKLLVGVMLVLGLSWIGYAQAADKVAPPAVPVVANVPQQSEVKTIFSFQKELGLTDKQIADIKALTLGLKDSLTAKTQEILALRQNLKKMVAAKEDIKKIRVVLKKVADIQVDNTCRDLEVSRKVEAVLTPAQWSQWKAIQEKTRAEGMPKAASAQPAVK